MQFQKTLTSRYIFLSTNEDFDKIRNNLSESTIDDEMSSENS